MLVKNISYSLFFKIAGMVLSLLMVPILLELVGVEGYGTWAALTSVIVWITLFDFGMGHALKNTVSKSLVDNDIDKAAREFYQVVKLSAISSLVALIIFLIATQSMKLFQENLYIALILFIPIILFFPFRTSNFVLQGARLIGLEAGLMFINTAVFFIIVFSAYLFGLQIGLYSLALAFVASYIISTLLVWSKAVTVISCKWFPISEVSISNFNMSRIKVGLKFFGLQVSSLVLYSLGVVIVYSFLSSAQAAQFDVVSKIFVFGLSFFTIVIGAFWPEISNLLAKKDFLKIRNLYLKMLGLSTGFSLTSFFVAYFSPQIISLWTGGKIEIEIHQAIYFALLISLQAFAYSGAVILNVYEKINIQLILSIIATALMVPMSIFLINNEFGIESVPIASSIFTFIAMLYCNIHAFRLIKS